jgi:hypothetical protein
VADEDRQFVDVETIGLLTKRLADLTDAQARTAMAPHVAKWLEVSGIVVNVTLNQPQFDTLVSIVCSKPQTVLPLFFPREDQRPLELNKGDGIVVHGQITDFTSAAGIGLENCEVVRVIPRAELERDAQARAAEEEGPGELAELGADAPKDRPRLPDAALRAWFEAFRIAYPTGSVTLAEKSAVAAFPQHHVARKRIHELFPNAPRGRPKKNNELANPPKSNGE